MDDDAIGRDGDFVATAAYVVKPRPRSLARPRGLRTLGVGGGFVSAALRTRTRGLAHLEMAPQRIPWPNLTRFFVISFQSLL